MTLTPVLSASWGDSDSFTIDGYTRRGGYTALTKALPSNLIALDKSDAQDSDAIVVTKDTATKYNLTEIGDLGKPAK